LSPELFLFTVSGSQAVHMCIFTVSGSHLGKLWRVLAHSLNSFRPSSKSTKNDEDMHLCSQRTRSTEYTDVLIAGISGGIKAMNLPIMHRSGVSKLAATVWVEGLNFRSFGARV
jgi:hypothetical protein